MQRWDTGTPVWPGSGTSNCPMQEKKTSKWLKAWVYIWSGTCCKNGHKALSVQQLAMATLSFVIQNIFYMLGTCFSSSQTGCECFQQSRMFPINYAGGNQNLFEANHASAPDGSSSDMGFHWEWRQPESHAEMGTTSCMHSELEIPVNSFTALMLKQEYKCL